MTEPPPPSRGFLTRLGQRLGLVYPEDGSPARDGQRRSRYGLYVSRRLDQDLDDLRARLSALEEGRASG